MALSVNEKRQVFPIRLPWHHSTTTGSIGLLLGETCCGLNPHRFLIDHRHWPCKRTSKDDEMKLFFLKIVETSFSSMSLVHVSMLGCDYLKSKNSIFSSHVRMLGCYHLKSKNSFFLYHVVMWGLIHLSWKNLFFTLGAIVLWWLHFTSITGVLRACSCQNWGNWLREMRMKTKQ